MLAALVLAVSGIAGIASLLRPAASADANASTTQAQPAASRVIQDRSSRGLPTGPCARPAPLQSDVVAYLTTSYGQQFGPVTASSPQPAICQAITKFQQWAQVPTTNGVADAVTAKVARDLAATDLSSCKATDAPTVCVDLTHQILWVATAGKVTFGPVPVRTGKAEDATPIGSFEVGQKKAYTISTEYNVPLPFWTQFYKDFGLHAADVDSPLYATNVRGSHGCVNMLLRDAQSLFGITKIGTPVHVWGKKVDA
ncbi:L,D-transpeptidase [Fodinicola feengrottensis]|uniref:L,D-transpeptidase family protein n=1 Tax=Fodinicola feengrottensis TaxID=435914 RepID=A0ABP4UBY2_9ACTN|nr:L,D-transpeptidase [Fodinicola feengrottensis]